MQRWVLTGGDVQTSGPLQEVGLNVHDRRLHLVVAPIGCDVEGSLAKEYAKA